MVLLPTESTGQRALNEHFLGSLLKAITPWCSIYPGTGHGEAGAGDRDESSSPVFFLSSRIIFLHLHLKLSISNIIPYI